MKSILSFTTLVLFALSLNTLQAQAVSDTATMGPGYANDVFYSFENGVIKTETRSNWDIAFYTTVWSAGVIANDGNGVLVYTYPNADTSGWNSVNITGIDTWTPMYNSDTIWEDGAFNRNSLGHPDYGWGIYNMISHDVVGDSLYIVQLPNGSHKKLWLQRKNSVANTFYFRYADIDGSNEMNVVINSNDYASKLFVYYSLMIGQVVDREPAKDSWDVAFSRYMAIVYDQEGNPSYYPVVGILQNANVGANRFQPVNEDFEDWTAAPFELYKTRIGHNWKTFDMNSFSWLIEEDLAYFVQTQEGNVYKFVPSYFGGTANGKTGFLKKVISLVGNTEVESGDNSFVLYPNPANGKLTITGLTQLSGNIIMYDQLGKQIYNQAIIPGQSSINLDLTSFTKGLYVVRIVTDNTDSVQKLMVN
jgi:hypothetical protein